MAARKRKRQKQPEQLELTPGLGSKFDNVACENCGRETPRRFGPRCAMCELIPKAKA